jgi:hypothetical protein
MSRPMNIETFLFGLATGIAVVAAIQYTTGLLVTKRPEQAYRSTTAHKLELGREEESEVIRRSTTPQIQGALLSQ